MQIPFYPNTGDGTHCWQAALKMALKYFEPEKDFSYEELDEITAKQEGKWTWPTAGMLWLLERGYQLKLFTNFDYQKFADRGGDYIIEQYGEEIGRAQIENSDIEHELQFTKKFISLAPLQDKLPDFTDLEKFLQVGWVIICNINSAALHWRPGYSGHFIVLCEVSADEVVLHDPGLPAREYFRVSRASFQKAWAYPSEQDKNLLAIKKPA